MPERCHGGTKGMVSGGILRKVTGFDTAICPERPEPDRRYCKMHLAEALARQQTVVVRAEAGLRWPGVTTGVHVRQRGTYQKLAPR